MAKEIKTLSDLTPDNKNFNKGTEHGGRLLGDSISRFGCGRSILVDKDGNIIAGNKTAEKCAELGIEKVRVVETSGDELVVVKRTDIELDSDRGREMALADNVTSLKDLDLDLELIEDCLGDDVLDRWGLKLEKIEESEENSNAKDFGGYSLKLSFPDDEKMNLFMNMYKEELEQQCGCVISFQ